MNTLYMATSPSGKMYVGVSQRFEQRIREHKRGKSPFSYALRKYGLSTFRFRLFKFDTIEEAYQAEALLVTPREVISSYCYNQCIGGKIAFAVGNKGSTEERKKTVTFRMRERMLGPSNPMNTPAIKARVMHHLKTNNPMHSEVHKATHLKAVNTLAYKEVQRAGSKARMTPEMQIRLSKGNPNSSKIQIGLVCYSSIREAAAATGMDRCTIRYKVKSVKCPNYVKLN